MKKLSLTYLLALVLAAYPASAGQQNKTSKPLAVVVNHVVTLTWIASTSPNVVSYNIYYSSINGGPYMKLGSVLAPTTTFVDKGEASGTTVYYVVTAVDSSNLESAFSTQATAVIP